MLTMLNAKAKEKALNEYWRVLKPGGRLLTHDVAYEDPKTRQVLDELRQTIHVNVAPLSLTGWQALYQEHGFSQVTYQHGKMSLMTPRGMIKDEGLMNTLNIMRRGLKKENRQQFLKMRRFFTRTGKNLCYIAVKSVK